MMRYNKTCWAIVNHNWYERPNINEGSDISIVGPIIFERKKDAERFMRQTIERRKSNPHWKPEYARFFRITKVKASINEI